MNSHLIKNFIFIALKALTAVFYDSMSLIKIIDFMSILCCQQYICSLYLYRIEILETKAAAPEIKFDINNILKRILRNNNYNIAMLKQFLHLHHSILITLNSNYKNSMRISFMMHKTFFMQNFMTNFFYNIFTSK